MSNTDFPSLSRNLNEFGRRRIAQVLIFLFISVAIYLFAAGRLDLPWIWVYMCLAILSVFLGGLYVMRYNPEAINERGRPAEKQPKWDKILISVYFIFYAGVYIVAGLDARFGWSQVPLWLHLLGFIVTALGSTITYAAMAHNKFLSMYVQVAEDRGHQVATQGPYRYVRHPMYISVIISWPALAFLLDSWWALVVGGIASGLIILRTALEDRKLLRELHGYSDYAKHVRYRLLPRIW